MKGIIILLLFIFKILLSTGIGDELISLVFLEILLFNSLILSLSLSLLLLFVFI